MHNKKFAGGAYSNKFPQNANRMRTMVGPGADMSFKGGDYSNKFPQSVNRMRTMVGPGADMSFVGGAYSDKFAVPASHTNEQSGFSKSNNFGHGGTLHDGNSYFHANHHDSFNPRNNHSNASGEKFSSFNIYGYDTPYSPIPGGCQPPNCMIDGRCEPCGAKQVGNGTIDPYGRKSRRSSADRISVNPVGGVADREGCPRDTIRCKDCDGYFACHPPHKCCQRDPGARQMNASGRKSRRSSVDRISVNPVGGAARESGGCKPTKCGHYNNASCPAGCRCSSTYNGICKGGGGGFTGAGAKVTRGAKQMNASGCGYNNFHHKSSFSSNINKYNTFR